MLCLFGPVQRLDSMILVLLRRDAGIFLEYLREMALIMEIEQTGDLKGRGTRESKELFSFFDLLSLNIFGDGHACLLLE